MKSRSSIVPLLLMWTLWMLAACNRGQPSDPESKARALSALDARPQLRVQSDDFVATFDVDSAALSHFVFRDSRFERDGVPIDLVTTDKPAYLPLGLSVDGKLLTSGFRGEALGPSAVRFMRKLDNGLVLVRKVEAGQGPYQLWSTLRIDNPTGSARNVQVAIEGHHYVRREHEQGGFLAGRSPLVAAGICVADDAPKRADREEIVEEKPTVEGDVSFGSVDTVYFTQAIAADGKPFAKCSLFGSDRGGTVEKPEGALLNVQLSHPKMSVPAHGSVTLRTLAYLGPKSPKALAAAGHGLRRASYVGGLPGIDSIAHGLVAMLAFIQAHVIGNWGVAIILLTLFVKLVLYPLTAKSFESIAAMRRLKPAIDAINEKYADDREKKGAAMMDLYKQHKINPFGGCLPQLLQLPVWWALYTSLSTNVELFKRPFFGYLQDLAAPDPFFVLPLGLGLLMFVQQKITPSTMDPAQAKMMLYVMPIMITSFMLFLPAGLCLYMFTNSVLSIGQQRLIELRLAHKHPAAQVVGSSAASSSSDADKDASSGRTKRGRA